MTHDRFGGRHAGRRDRGRSENRILRERTPARAFFAWAASRQGLLLERFAAAIAHEKVEPIE
jgi:hypothetical protein